jgi:hypothetical protein
MEGDETTHHFVGLDLGPIGQFTGLAAVERRGFVDDMGRVKDSTYAVRHLARFPPATPQSELIEECRKVLAELPKEHTLVVDRTAVGHSVFELFRKELSGHSVDALSVGAGAAGTDGRGGSLVPKVELVGVMQVLLKNRRFEVAPSPVHAPTLAGSCSSSRCDRRPSVPSPCSSGRSGRTMTWCWPQRSPPGRASGTRRSTSRSSTRGRRSRRCVGLNSPASRAVPRSG